METKYRENKERRIDEKFSRDNGEVVYQINHNYSPTINYDQYCILLGEKKSFLMGTQVMDDNYMSHGSTSWSAIIPNVLAKKILEDINNNTEVKLTQLARVKKTSDNYWGEYGQHEVNEEEYEYPVRLNFRKDEDFPILEIEFQKVMGVYF